MRIITEFAKAKEILSAKKTLYPTNTSLNIEESYNFIMKSNQVVAKQVRAVFGVRFRS